MANIFPAGKARPMLFQDGAAVIIPLDLADDFDTGAGEAKVMKTDPAI